MGYENAPATILLATHCCCCGRPLVDATSVELGIGPECRSHDNAGIDNFTREACNKLTYAAAIAAQDGNIAEVNRLADAVKALGLETLADKIRHRFNETAIRKQIKITITQVDANTIGVKTPYRRGAKEAFISAWRNIPSRRYDRTNNRNTINTRDKAALFALLRQFFPGVWAEGPKGIFRIPKPQDGTERPQT